MIKWQDIALLLYESQISLSPLHGHMSLSSSPCSLLAHFCIVTSVRGQSNKSIFPCTLVHEFSHASLELLEVNLAIAIDIALLNELAPDLLIDINVMHL